jgi:hypothetical protein
MSDVVTERLGQLKSDRFFTDDVRPEIYSEVGIEYIRKNTMLHVPRRHHPQLAPALEGVPNAFAPWKKLTGPRADPATT